VAAGFFRVRRTIAGDGENAAIPGTIPAMFFHHPAISPRQQSCL